MKPFARIVLADLRSSRTPLSAYDLSRRISASQGKACAPNTVYRSLYTLIDAGLVRHVASLKAFIALSTCNGTSPAFLICKYCGTVRELNATRAIDDLATLAKRQGFSASRFCIEIIGQCEECRAATYVV